MNEQDNEQIFDSLVEEMLTNQHPPDLTDVIQQRLRQELGPEQFQILREQKFRYTQLRAPVITPDVNPALHSRSTHVVSWQAAIPLAIVLAASIMLALGLWPLLNPANRESPELANRTAQQSLPTPSHAEQPSLPVERSQASQRHSSQNQLAQNQLAQNQLAQSDQPRNAPPTNRSPEVHPIDLPTDNVPFPQQSALPEFGADRQVVSQAAHPLSDEEIIDWVDAQFAAIWNSQQLAVPTAVDQEELNERVARLLTKQSGVARERSLRDLANKLVGTASFAENWAGQIVQVWLRGTGVSRAQVGLQLEQYLSEQLVAGRPWNEVLAGLVGSAPEQSESKLLAALAGSDNHRLASRLGHILLDEALACARCHDASDNGHVISTDQDQYWSLVAMFNGLDAQTLEQDGQSRLVLIDRQLQLFSDGKSPNLFFDRPDGRLQAAQYRLPDGDNWRTMQGAQTPRASLAKWIATTSVTDKASINLAWRLVFGRPLVAQHSALDGEGSVQRRLILEKLASQFQAHGRDMRRLVTWLVSSRPFASGRLDIDRNRWIAASDAELQQWNRGLTNFAIMPAALPERVASLENALVLVDQWSGNSADRRAMLAQPTPSPLTQPGTPLSQPAATSLPPTGFLVRSANPTAGQAVFIKRLAGSKLTWTQQVDHIAGLVGEPAGNAKLHGTAQKLLDSRSGDRQAALFQLLQGAMLCQESQLRTSSEF